MISLLLRLLGCRLQVWEYGLVRETVARRNLKTGEVQFQLWKAGEHGHKNGYWHAFGAGHEKHFVPFDD